jgi:hypothetical protein
MSALTVLIAVVGILLALALLIAPTSLWTVGIGWLLVALLGAAVFGRCIQAGNRGRHERY